MHSVGLPDEIIWNIAHFLTLPSTAPKRGARDDSSMVGDYFLRARWADVKGFAMASNALREIALKNWFRVLHLRRERDFDIYSERYPFVFQYTTAIVWHATINDDEHAKLACDFFSRFAGRALRSVRVVLSVPEEISLEFKSCIREVLQAIGACCTSAPSSPESPITAIRSGNHSSSNTTSATRVKNNNITRLEIYNEMFPSPDLARLIAEAVPQLEELKLRQPSMWCNSCFTCNIPRFTQPHAVERFKPVVYPDGRGLPALWASRLSTLPNLHAVSITVAFKLSGGRSDFPSSASLSPESNGSRPSDLAFFPWTGECSSCLALFQRDPGFLETTRDAKMNNTNVPPNLKRVEWRFLPISTFVHEDDNWSWIGKYLFD